MALPIATLIKSLQFNFRGRPFFHGSKTAELKGLGVNFRGLPYAGVQVEQSDQVITVPAGVVTIECSIVTVLMIVTSTPADIAITGECVNAEVRAGITMLECLPGEISLAGTADRYGWLSVIAEPGVVTPGGAVSAIVVTLILFPGAGTATIDGSAATLGPVAILAGSKKVYECVLSADGLSDVIVPIESFTSRQRAGDPSYTEVIIPGLDCLVSVLARQSGTVTVWVKMVKKGITLQREKLFESEITSVAISGNERRHEIMLSGYRTTTAADVPAVIPVSKVNYKSVDRGVTTIRKPEPDLYMRPGDTVQYDGDEFTVELITYSHSAIYGSSMEISG